MRDYAVFILSHARADNQLTLKSLIESGYTGDWYIVCDDLDEQLEKYKEKYGDNRILVFNKKEIEKQADFFTYKPNYKVATFARVAAKRFAKLLGYKYYVQCDDDFKGFFVRYVQDNKFKSAKITDLDRVFRLCIDMLNTNENICSVGFGRSDIYIGWLKGIYSKGFSYFCHALFIAESEGPLNFVSAMNEDVIANANHAAVGKLMISLTDFCFATPASMVQEGGMTDFYKSSSGYVNGFYAKMSRPSAFKIRYDGKKFTLAKLTNNMIPKIMKEVCRK